jgi:hypothetical protein
MEVGEAQRLKSLEDENRRLKQLVADLSLDKEALKGPHLARATLRSTVLENASIACRNAAKVEQEEL